MPDETANLPAVVYVRKEFDDWSGDYGDDGLKYVTRASERYSDLKELDGNVVVGVYQLVGTKILTNRTELRDLPASPDDGPTAGG